MTEECYYKKKLSTPSNWFSFVSSVLRPILPSSPGDVYYVLWGQPFLWLNCSVTKGKECTDKRSSSYYSRHFNGKKNFLWGCVPPKIFVKALGMSVLIPSKKIWVLFCSAMIIFLFPFFFLTLVCVWCTCVYVINVYCVLCVHMCKCDMYKYISVICMCVCDIYVWGVCVEGASRRSESGISYSLWLSTLFLWVRISCCTWSSWFLVKLAASKLQCR